MDENVKVILPDGTEQEFSTEEWNALQSYIIENGESHFTSGSRAQTGAYQKLRSLSPVSTS